MKISKQIKKLVEANNELWMSFAKDKYAAWLQQAIDIIEASEKSKHIWNVDFEDGKSRIKWAYGSAHKAVKAYVEKETGISDEDSDTWRRFCIYVAHDSPKDSTKVVKEYDVMSGKAGVAIKMYNDVYVKPHLALMERMLALKPYIEKGRKPNPNAEPKPTFKPAKSSVKDLAAVKAVYDDLLKEWYPIQVKEIIDHWKDNLDKTLKVLNSDDTQSKKALDMFMVQTFFTQERYRGAWNIKDGAEASMPKEAERVVTDIQKAFIAKNLSKVTSIVSAKGGLEDVKLLDAKVGSGGKLNGQIKFTFNDGSMFTVHNASVIHFQYAGKSKFFMRFPTTFHNVVMSDGTKHAMRSEEQMNKDFAGIK